MVPPTRQDFIFRLLTITRQVQVLSTLPLKALSYYWGRFNEIQLPVFLRAPGFKLYSFFFGVNLDEVAEPLPHYRNLAEFFYRQLKPGVRPIDPRHNTIISPADGKILQFGEVRAGGHVEQVKGMTYSLDAFLGTETSPNPDAVVHAILTPDEKHHAPARQLPEGDSDSESPVISTTDQEFANVNGIQYTLPSLLSGTSKAPSSNPHDASTSPVDGATTEVAKDLVSTWWSPKKRLFYAVVYLAPGDYHRFHSPVPWVVERRRHFNGELYSVSPLFQNRMPGLFTLNERVALLGRWRHGLFSMTLVGATNVGSIKIHFDRELRTNSFTKPVGDEAEGGFAEATYKGASTLLGGHPLTKGAEVGGFNLGSTVVLVFEAPGEGKDAFKWAVKRGQTVKFGEVLGVVGSDDE